ncbi:MAG: cupin domain protein [Frankiales bacterium]|nr:cupin domain protein [Frankiales bacterium]
MAVTRRAAALSRPARTSLSPIELIEYTRHVAGEVAGGSYPYVQFDEEQRWHQRIYRDARVDLWLISWLPSQGTLLHDHGGSSGAFTVVEGELSEAVHTNGSLREWRRGAGASAGFGTRYVHDLRNLSSEPAVSVHAYSPPLTAMNFYELVDGRDLLRVATLQTDDPEHEPGPRASAA